MIVIFSYCVLEESEFEFGFFRHHVFGPFGFENNININGVDALYTADFLSDIFDEEVSCRTAWCGEGHSDSADTVIDVNAVDKPQVVYIDRYFWVENGFDHP